MRRITKYIIVGVSAVALVFLVGSSRSDFNVGRNIEVFFNLMKALNLNYVDSIDNQKLIKAASDAMLRTLDPYTEYIPKDEVDEFNTMTTGKYGGVGSAIRKPHNSKYVVFAEITEGFAIYNSGINPGDAIMAVDTVNMYDVEDAKVSAAMRGTPGTKVTLTVKSIKDGSIKDYTLIRQNIALASNYSGILKDSTGYIGFNNFSEGSGEIFRNEFKKLKKQGIKSLIVDLRSNGGGIVDESITLLSSFLPKGTLVTKLKGRSEKLLSQYSTTIEPIDTLMPLAILINSYSASASEIVAGAIQDYDRGVIIGNKSVGKGLVQRPQSLGYGDMAKITHAKYYIPSGRCIQAIDYFHKNEDGLADKVQDSLRMIFYTKSGRKVLDAGGIEPDFKVKPRILNRFVISVIVRGYFADYADTYHINNPEIGNIKEFKVGDKEFEEFKAMIGQNEVEFTPISLSHFKKLKESAESEDYYEKIKEELEAIDKVLNYRNTVESLDENKDVIKEMLASEIISRYHYMRGKMEYSLMGDKYANRAIDILNNSVLYANKLKPEVVE